MPLDSLEFQEIKENIEQLEYYTLEYEKSMGVNIYDISCVYLIFRFAHNLKGSLKLMQLNRLSDLVHAIESCYDSIRQFLSLPTKELINITLDSTDLIMKSVKSNEEDPDKISQYIEKTNSCIKNHSVIKIPLSKVDIQYNSEEEKKLKETLAKKKKLFLVRKTISIEYLKNVFDILPTFNDIKKIGDWIAYSPKAADPESNQKETVIKILFYSDMEAAKIKTVLLDLFQEVVVPQNKSFDTGITAVNEEKPHDETLPSPDSRYSINVELLADQKYRIGLNGEITIDHIVQVKEKLQKVYKQSSEIELDLRNTVLLDMSALQLIFSLNKSALKEKKKFLLKITRDSDIFSSLSHSGLFPSVGSMNYRSADFKNVYHIQYQPSKSVFLSGLDLLGVYRELVKIGEFKVEADKQNIPYLEDLDPEKCWTSWKLSLMTDADLDTVKDKLVFLEFDKESSIRIETEVLRQEIKSDGDKSEDIVLKKTEDNVPASQFSQGGQSVNNEDFSVRIASQKLDKIVDLVGELVIAQAQLSRLSFDLKNNNLEQISESIGRLSDELRNSSMNARMAPVGMLFGRFKRLVRDLSSALEKDVEFITEGDDTELDKTVIEKLYDPMVHLVRNAIDHGIEKVETRIKNGKKESGRLRLSAYQSGSNVYINIADDGAGIDTEKVRQKAIEKGLLQPGKIISDKEAYQYLFASGFSTAEKVSDISGRGVGLDIVKSNIESLRGSVDIQSIQGKGTKIILRFPLTMAIIEGLLLEIDQSFYIIPLSSVEECIDIDYLDDFDYEKKHLINIRGSAVPYIRLRDMFGLDNEYLKNQQMIIVRDIDSKIFGIIADKIIGKYQTVIKALGKMHSDRKEFSGATILGDGKIALILDINRIISIAEENTMESGGSRL